MTNLEKAAFMLTIEAQNAAMNYARSMPLDAAEHFEVGFLAGAQSRDPEINALKAEMEKLRAVVEAARKQNNDVIEVLNAESTYNEMQAKRAGVRSGHFLIDGRWEINSAMYRLSYSAEAVRDLLAALEGGSDEKV